MTAQEHKHQCISCTPNIAPDYDINDYRIYTLAKSGTFHVLDNGVDVGYTKDVVKEGKEGWYMFAGETTKQVHMCSCEQDVCVELRFGDVKVICDALPST